MASLPQPGTITLSAQSDLISDAVRRTLQILPSTKYRDRVISRRVTGPLEDSIRIKMEVIPGTVKAQLTLALTSSDLIEKALPTLENLLREPYGCFEQTSIIAFTCTGTSSRDPWCSLCTGYHPDRHWLALRSVPK